MAMRFHYVVIKYSGQSFSIYVTFLLSVSISRSKISLTICICLNFLQNILQIIMIFQAKRYNYGTCLTDFRISFRRKDVQLYNNYNPNNFTDVFCDLISHRM